MTRDRSDDFGLPRLLLSRGDAPPPPWLGRRAFLKGLLAAGAGLAAAPLLRPGPARAEIPSLPAQGAATQVFVAKAASYSADLRRPIVDGLWELGVAQHLRGCSVVLKPNLVEPRPGQEHVTTHPLVLRAAVEAFLSLGAARVSVAEGSGHVRDPYRVLEASGLLDVLREDRIPFVDLNTAPARRVANLPLRSGLAVLALPEPLLEADLVVSLAKMKTHHWSGVSLSMKNLFGVLPGRVYGWPKNVLHWAGIHNCAVDVLAALAPGLALVDGIVGMEGDGPIMGAPAASGVLVLGRSLPATDAACCRIMGLPPERIGHLALAQALGLGNIGEAQAAQLGESLASVRRPYLLRRDIPAQAALLAP